MIRFFTLQYWRDNGWYVGRLREVPGVFSQGESLEELEENIQDAYREMMKEEEQVVPAVGVQARELGVEV
jgi:predicted RNase H-like HicB family nuclease